MRHEFWIDRGGTFTDCLLFDWETGELTNTKVLSSDDSPLVAIRELLKLPPDAPIPPCHIKMGTTVATNALLERKGANTGLLITRGFRDLLVIGDQTRPDLFDLNIQRPKPLYQVVEEISARLSPTGAALESPTSEELEKVLAQLITCRVESIALVVIHAYANPQFERELKNHIQALLDKANHACRVVASTEAANEQGFLARASTTVVDAYLTPLLSKYLEKLQNHLPGSRLELMQSSGGLIAPDYFRGPASLLSGPAGGVVAAERIARLTKSQTLIAFDMGGTSTDVSLIRGQAERRYETIVAGIPLRAPLMDIHTVAAGGGSVCAFDGYGLTVGPESVGSNPGPICYGRSTTAHPELALSDINLALGRVMPDYFPFKLDEAAALKALATLAQSITTSTGEMMTSQMLARAFVDVANANMSEAIRTVTVGRGIDVRSADLLVFGGAAGQHACSLALSLGISRIFIHRYSGILSAFGIGHADRLWTSELDAGRPVLTNEALNSLEPGLRTLEAQGKTALGTAGTTTSLWELALRYRGTDSALQIPWSDSALMRGDFEAQHLKRFGFLRPDAEIEIVTARVSLRIVSTSAQVVSRIDTPEPQACVRPSPMRFERVHLERRVEPNTPVYHLASLPDLFALRGPALLLDATGTYLVDDDFEAVLDGELLTLSRLASSTHLSKIHTSAPDIARIQILASRFASSAEQMGEALRQSASSTNIRDRLDFSCALFDVEGRLIANAPHIPVHLGAMSESVSAVLDRFPTLAPGEAYVTNDPALGGSHLPDITVVSPVFDSSGRLVCITASRGHHADVGGISPGSMPAFSQTLAEEGVVLSAVRLVSGDILQEDSIRKLLGAGPYPARNPDENLADLRAQLAANQLGGRLILELAHEIGTSELTRAMDDVRELSSQWMRDAILALPDGTGTFRDRLDNGAEVVVSITISGCQIEIDFQGSAPEQNNNFNAPRAVTVACVMYVMRTLLARPMPLNEGCLAPVRLIIPEKSLLNPSPGCPVAAGNVETSSRIVDVLLGALGVAAASQGTMNNLSFGNDTFGYYETIAGGGGAGPTFSGASGVHTHMTNTRITDPEVLEERFPVRLIEFSLREQSGGDGAQRGGDGVSRTIEAIAPLTFSLLTTRRETAPFGLAGGGAGAAGINRLNGKVIPACAEGELQPGDRLQIETPGGGGYGRLAD